MTDTPSRKQEARKGREERLAASLRENLKKRKAQARARSEERTAPAADGDAPRLTRD